MAHGSGASWYSMVERTEEEPVAEEKKPVMRSVEFVEIVTTARGTPLLIWAGGQAQEFR